MGNSRSKREDSKYDDEDLSYEEDENALQYLELHLTRIIAYAESADASLQREVAERLANEAVKPERQVQIVDLGGLRLLIPLTRSADGEVQRLAAHALANLSVNAMNQVKMADEGGIDVLIDLLAIESVHVQRQASKALANIGVILLGVVRVLGLLEQLLGLEHLRRVARGAVLAPVDVVEVLVVLLLDALDGRGRLDDGGVRGVRRGGLGLVHGLRRRRLLGGGAGQPERCEQTERRPHGTSSSAFSGCGQPRGAR